METLQNCPICHSDKTSPFLVCKDYVASGESFSISYCNNCTHQFTNPRPEASHAYKYYQSENYISHSGSEKKRMGLIYTLYDIVRNFSLSLKINIIKQYNKKGSLLDLGCGLGYFYNAIAKEETFEPFGADISDEAISYVQKTFNLPVLKEDQIKFLPENKFSVITQWHVLEHVYDLDARMKELKHLLEPEGTMFIAVPINNSFDSKFYKSNWDGYDVPRHIHHFNSKSMKTLMNRYQFRVISSKPMWFDAPYVSMRSETHKGNKYTSFIKGGITGIISNFLGLFTHNYSSILFIIKHE